MRDIDELVKTIEKLIKDHGVSVSESDKERLEQMLEDLRQTSYSDGFDTGYSSGYGDAVSEMSDEPAADVQEVKHGHRVLDDGTDGGRRKRLRIQLRPWVETED